MKRPVGEHQEPQFLSLDSFVTDLEWAMACSLALVSQKRYFGAKCFEILIKALQVATWYSWKREENVAVSCVIWEDKLL